MTELEDCHERERVMIDYQLIDGSCHSGWDFSEVRLGGVEDLDFVTYWFRDVTRLALPLFKITP